MSLIECLKVALSAVSANKLRAFLTMLGVIIGVGSVITLVSLGQGASAAITGRISELGTNLIMVQPGRMLGGGARGTAEVLTYAHALAIEQQASSVAAVAPQISRTANIRYEGKSLDFSVIGTTPEYLTVRNAELAWGRFILPDDLTELRRVAVLGAEAAREIFGLQDPVGRNIRINQRNFEVVGILVEKGEGAMMSPDSSVIVPLTTAQSRLFGTQTLGTINVQAASSSLVHAAELEISAILTTMLRSPDSFYITNMQEMLSVLEGATMTFTLLLAGIAGVSLLVGGIGIMNIMLVSVTERTREIGIRKAIGATKRDVLLQFVIEAVVLSGLGGVLGILAGASASNALSGLLNFPTVIALEPVLIGFGFSLAVGLFFGIWPASRAAALDPIEALRYE